MTAQFTCAVFGSLITTNNLPGITEGASGISGSKSILIRLVASQISGLNSFVVCSDTRLGASVMKRYWAVVGTMIVFFLLLFLLVEWLQIPLLTDPSPWMGRGGAMAAVLGVALLIADVVLPVPSSLVMIAHGVLFGVALGTLLSLVGSVGAALTGFALGRRGGKLLDRIVTADERDRVERMLERWGALAVVVTRPVPLLAEATAVMAGASAMSWQRVTIASLAGSLPPSLLYALTGSVAASFQNITLMFCFIMLISAAFWIISRKLAQPRMAKDSGQ